MSKLKKLHIVLCTKITTVELKIKRNELLHSWQEYKKRKLLVRYVKIHLSKSLKIIVKTPKNFQNITEET